MPSQRRSDDITAASNPSGNTRYCTDATNCRYFTDASNPIYHTGSTDTIHLADGSPDGRHSVAQTSPGRNRYLEFTEWNGSKRVDLRFWKDGTIPTKEGVSSHLDQWKALCNMSDAIDDLLTRVIEKEPVDWQYYIGDDVFVTIKAPFPFVHIRKHFIPAGEWTYHPTKRGVALHFGEWKELKQIIPLLEEREPELRELVPLYRTDL
jgi:hypothetical protein